MVVHPIDVRVMKPTTRRAQVGAVERQVLESGAAFILICALWGTILFFALNAVLN